MGVKLDMSRDYYADLEVPRLADANEIKKSFKKLALKYHPDRNPGKEEEAKEKFILIQAAHEILTNPEAKASYDAKRRNATRHGGGGASGVTGNPWMNTARDVNNKYGVPPVRRPPMPPRPAQTTTTGASSRYQGWGTGKQAPKSKTDTFRAQSEAWDRARASSTQKTTQNPSRPTKNPGDVPPSPTPRTAAQARRAEAAFGATRRTGFQPSSPTPGDEPPVRNYNYNNYTSTSTGDWAAGTGYTTANAGSTPAPKPRPHSEFIDPLTQQFRDANLDNRQRTPYASHTGEKTNPFEPLSVNRAKSMRDPGRTVPGEQPAPSPRQRSASVGSDSFQRSATDPYPSHTNPRPQPQSKASARYSPRTAHQQQQPDSAPATSAGFATAAGFGAAAAAGAAAYAAANSSTSSVNSSTHATVNAGTSSTQAKSGPKVFAVPDNDPTSPLNQTRFARHSADNINTQFVSEDQGNFEFSAATDSPSRDDPFMRARQRHRGRQSPLRNEFTASQDRFTPVQPQQPPQVPPKVSAFDAKEWEESIKSSHIFEPKPQSRSSVSPTRPMRPIKKPRPVRMTAGNAAVVDDEETTSGEDKPKTASPNINGNRSPNAMDVDPPEPETPIHPHEPRNIPVEPTKPEWRAGNVGPNVPGGAPLNPMPATGFRMPAVNPNTVGSEDSEFMKPNIFSDFKNCAPFNEKPTGLGSFADLSMNLPFTSAPSAKLPIPQSKPEPLPCRPAPPVPKVPVSLVISTAKIGSPAWNQYAKEFEAYLKAFSVWNGQMVKHFADRQASYEQTGFSWVNVVGDAGYTNYTNAMEQDKPFRQKWITACNAHELAFKEFQQLRWGLLRER